ncbi:MAG: L-lactate dehydrogenase [Omnitrophica WOR_2 bacterium]
MKVGIIGSGLVGATAAYALVMRGIGREIILVDVNKERSTSEAEDILHAVPFSNPMQVYAGDYEDLAGSSIVIITAGANQKPGETRLQLLGRNAAILKQIIPGIIQHAPEAILLVASNPVDILTHLAWQFAKEAGIPSNHIFGSGTTLDTARFRALLGRHLGVDAQHIHGYVIGEHGDSEVLTWSLVSVGGIPLDEFCRRSNVDLCGSSRQEIDRQVRQAAYTIIQGKGATYYGIGSALARIVEAVLKDQRAILTICTPEADVAGVKDVTVSLPHLIGGQGILSIFPLPLDEQEENLLHNSAAIVRKALDEYESTR